MTDTMASSIRSGARVTQAVMAAAMGLPLRTYEDLEAGKVEFRPVHLKAANMARIEIAVEKGDRSVLPPALVELVLKAAALLNEKPAS